MRLSIAIPFYKGQSFLKSCLDSIVRSYELSRKKIYFELILVVDSPDKDSIEFIEEIVTVYSHKMTLSYIVNEKNLGVAASRNRAWRSCQTNLITFIDQDDEMNYNYFSVLEEKLDETHRCFVLNGYWFYPEKKKYKKVHFVSPDLSFESLVRQRYPMPTTGLMIFNKSLIKEDCLFPDVSEEYKGSDDWAAYLNLSLNYIPLNYKYIASPVFIINKHSSNYSGDLMHMFMCDFEVLKYFKNKLSDEKNRRLIDLIVRLKHLRVDRDVHRLSRKDLKKKYGALYRQYLINKRFFPRYVCLWLNKKVYSLFGKPDVIS